ncbi:MAG: DNA-binding response regulator [Chloroflexi bacterium]|nr:MAG: DNA-binding response regulator [Chloroflexota bacterium]
MSDTIRILVADDHSLFRSGVIHSLGEIDDFEVVGEAEDGRQAVEKAHEFMPDIILLDVTMEPVDGLQALNQLSAELPACKVIMLTVSEDEDTLLAALKAGARGYVLKGVAASELVSVIRMIHAGEVYVTPTMAASLLLEMANTPPSHAKDTRSFDQLTERERSILELVARGYTNRQIGEQLHLAEKTIKHYMTNILQKLQVNNRVQAALLAERKGLLKEDET